MRGARSLAVLLASCTLIAHTPLAHAAWPDDRYVDLGRLGSLGTTDAFIAPASQPGELFSCFYTQGGGAWNIQRFGTDGLPSWTGGGTPLVGEAGTYLHHLFIGSAYVPDDQSGLLHAFATTPSSGGGNALRLQRVNPDGTLTPPPLQYPTAWRLDTLTSLSSCLPAGTSDGAGGAYVVWYRSGLRMVRVDASGARVAPWPDRGWRIPGALSPSSLFTPPGVAPDGVGGVLVVWADDSVRVQRVNADSMRYSGWPAAGLALAPLTLGVNQDGTFTLVPSGLTHVIALWCEGAGPPGRRIMAQRFSLEGVRDPAWPAEGRRVDSWAPDVDWFGYLFRCLPDGEGGVLAGWQSAADYKLGGVRADGTLVPSFVALTRSEVYGNNSTTPIRVGMAAGRNGGVELFWRGLTGGVRGRWYDRGLQLDPSPALAEVEVRTLAEMAATPFEVTAVRAARSDDMGGAYLICEGVAPSTLPPTGSGILMHATQRGVIGVPPRAARFDLTRPAPNPARRAEGVSLRFAIPRTGHVRVQVLDVAGRVVRTLVDDGVLTTYSGSEAGLELAPRWAGCAARGRVVPPGLYNERAPLDGRAAVQRDALVD